MFRSEITGTIPSFYPIIERDREGSGKQFLIGRAEWLKVSTTKNVIRGGRCKGKAILRLTCEAGEKVWIVFMDDDEYCEGGFLIPQQY